MAAALEALRPGPAAARARGPVRVAASRAAVDGTAMSVAATVATAPLLALHFGRVPLAGLPANLLALPAVAPVMWLGMAKAAVGQLAALGPPAAAPAEAVASVLGWVAGVPLGYLSWVARAFADVPGGVVTPPLRSPAALLPAYALLLAGWAVASLLLRRAEDRAQEAAGSWRRLPRARRASVAAVAGAALVLVLGHLLAPPRPPHSFTVRFLDVGQGDATLIQDPSGAAILFDAGPARGGRLAPPAEGRGAPPCRGGGHPPLAGPSRRAGGRSGPLPGGRVLRRRRRHPRPRASGRRKRRPTAWASGGSPPGRAPPSPPAG